MKKQNKTQTTTTRTETTGRVRMSLHLPSDVVFATKAYCRENKITLGEAVADAIKLEIARG